MRLRVQELEPREVPAVLVWQDSGTVHVKAGDYDSVVFVSGSQATGVNVLTVDEYGVVNSYSYAPGAVTNLVMVGGAGVDGFFNFTDVSDYMDGQAGNDTLLGGTGASSTLIGGSGIDTIWARAAASSVNSADSLTDVVVATKSSFVTSDPNDNVFLF